MKWRDRISNVWWIIVARVNRRAYLVHEADNPHCDSEILEELLWLTTQEWTRRGEKVNVWIGDVSLPEGVKTPWVVAVSGPHNYIRWDILCKFRKIVEDAEYEKSRRRREGRELWVKYLTLIVAAVAALASVANYLSNRKR